MLHWSYMCDPHFWSLALAAHLPRLFWPSYVKSATRANEEVVVGQTDGNCFYEQAALARSARLWEQLTQSEDRRGVGSGKILEVLA